MIVTLYTDGACSGNPGPGGYAALIQSGIHEQVLRGAYRLTTNNRMELMAAIAGFEALLDHRKVICMTDSQYIQQAMTAGWLQKWQRSGWKTTSGKPVKNRDLWDRLVAAINGHGVTWQWVRGHSGHPLNERVDGLAVDAMMTMKREEDRGYEQNL